MKKYCQHCESPNLVEVYITHECCWRWGCGDCRQLMLHLGLGIFAHERKADIAAHNQVVENKKQKKMKCKTPVPSPMMRIKELLRGN